MTELAFVDRGARVAIRGLLLFFWTLRCCPLTLACGTLAIPVSADAGRDVHTRSAKKHCISSAICSVPPLLVQRRAALANRTVSGTGNETRLEELLNATNADAGRGLLQDLLRHAPNWTSCFHARSFQFFAHLPDSHGHILQYHCSTDHLGQKFPAKSDSFPYHFCGVYHGTVSLHCCLPALGALTLAAP